MNFLVTLEETKEVAKVFHVNTELQTETLQVVYSCSLFV